MMKFGLNQRTLEGIRGVFKDFPGIEEALIYGSRATGSYREGSDIDISLKGKLSFNERLRIETELDELMLPYMIDLSVYNAIGNKELVKHIDRVGRTLYSRIGEEVRDRG